MTQPFSIIAAVAQDGAIGQAGGLPWGRIEADTRWFQVITTSADPYAIGTYFCAYPKEMERGVIQSSAVKSNAIIMGRRTADSIKSPLRGRLELILHHHERNPLHDCPYRLEGPNGSVCPHDFDFALHTAALLHAPNIFIAGGAQVYAEALRHPGCERLYITQVYGIYPQADTWWPGLFYGPDKSRMRTERTDGVDWQRVHASDWLHTPDGRPIRFEIWEREE